MMLRNGWGTDLGRTAVKGLVRVRKIGIGQWPGSRNLVVERSAHLVERSLGWILADQVRVRIERVVPQALVKEVPGAGCIGIGAAREIASTFN